MNKGIQIAAIGLGMLFAQAVSANEMVRYEPGMYIAANTPSQQSATTTKKAPAAKSAHKHHHHKHHRHHHHHGHHHKHHHHHGHHHHHKHHHHGHHHHHHKHHCPTGHCHGGALPAHATLEDVEPKMDILDRERGARGHGGRGSR